MSTTVATPPDPPLIRFDFDKAAAHPLPGDPNHTGLGYDRRPDVPLTGIVWHTTEHQAGQSFTDLCEYLRDSRIVSAHYVIGWDGEIQRILDPGPFRAWHAGYSIYPPPPAVGLRDWNNFAVGVEVFHRQGGEPYTVPQKLALVWLFRTLMADHPTITKAGIVAHRWIATNAYDQQPPVEYGRKSDPSDLSDNAVRAFIAAL